MKIDGMIARGMCARQWFVRYVNPLGTEVKLGPFTSKAKAEKFYQEQVALYASIEKL